MLECYRYITRDYALWFALQVFSLWRCAGFCIDDARRNTSFDVILRPNDGGAELEREIRSEVLTVDVTGMKNLKNLLDLRS